jgi:glutathione-specific gamma-glutamylcyclotransferase
LYYPPRPWLELDASLERALAKAPHDPSRSDSWLLVYGSMLKDPPFTPQERQRATLPEWERVFCLADPRMRGTERHPGVSLGLVRGRGCQGLAYRLSARTARDDLRRVWRREMLLPFYVPCWLEVQTAQGPLRALTFCTDVDSPLYEPDLSEPELLERLATCSGESGSNAQYLDDTLEQLAAVGVSDERLARLAAGLRERGVSAT